MNEGNPRPQDPGYISEEFQSQIEGAVYGIGVGHEDAWVQYVRGGNYVGEHEEPPVPPTGDVTNLHNHGHDGLKHKPI